MRNFHQSADVYQEALKTQDIVKILKIHLESKKVYSEKERSFGSIHHPVRP